MASLPADLPLGEHRPERLADAIRKLQDHLRTIPTVEDIRFEGVLSLPLQFTVETRAPFHVALTGRPNPDSNSPVVEVLGLSWRYDATERLVVIESIDGVTTGSSYTLQGIVVGRRV